MKYKKKFDQEQLQKISELAVQIDELNREIEDDLSTKPLMQFVNGKMSLDDNTWHEIHKPRIDDASRLKHDLFNEITNLLGVLEMHREWALMQLALKISDEWHVDR